jgi:hypothetical protein
MADLNCTHESAVLATARRRPATSRRTCAAGAVILLSQECKAAPERAIQSKSVERFSPTYARNRDARIMRETRKRHNLIAPGLILALAIIAPSSSLTLRGQNETITNYHLAQYCVPNDDDGMSTGTIYC